MLVTNVTVMRGPNPCSWHSGKGYSHVGGLLHAHGLVAKVTVMWGANPCSWLIIVTQVTVMRGAAPSSWLSDKVYSHVRG